MKVRDEDRGISFVGIDIGGTFTDAVFFADNRMWIMKTPTTADDPVRGCMELLKQMEGNRFVLNHGSTLATNAVLERRGCPTAFITTRGFGDMLFIARQNRPRLYSLEIPAPEPLIERDRCFEVKERVDFRGDILRRTDRDELLEVLKDASATGARSLAVCLLFSYASEKNEKAVEQTARGLFDFISVSSSVLGEYREYERASTTVLNAYVSPILAGYISRLGHEVKKAGGVDFKIMESGGGILPGVEASRLGVRTILSGPAAGVAGAFHVAGTAGFDKIITLDMGGTSTDVSLCDGFIGETREGSIDGHPVRTPMVDIETIGAGGGSIARVDPGGVLKVGPRSAGSDPGPAAYGRSDEATLTDAHLVLGSIGEGDFLSGGFKVQRDRSVKAIMKLARRIGTTLQETASGVVRVALSHMERAMRIISLERGFDPGQFTLVPFGGAGPVHGPALAENLGIRRILIPRFPGVLSAMGMLLCDFRMDFIRTILVDLNQLDPGTLKMAAEELYPRARRFLDENYFNRAVVKYSLDLRYRGQSFELNVSLGRRDCPTNGGKMEIEPVPLHPDIEKIQTDFEELHRRRFGFTRPGHIVEAVNLRLDLMGMTPRPKIIPRQNDDRADLPEPCCEPRKIVLPDGSVITAPVFSRQELTPGCHLPSPSVMVQYDTVILVPPRWRATVDPWENIIMELET